MLKAQACLLPMTATCLLQVSLMDEAGNTKDDLSLPKGTDDAEKLATQIQEDFEAGKELVVTVLKVSLMSRDVFCFAHKHSCDTGPPMTSMELRLYITCQVYGWNRSLTELVLKAVSFHTFCKRALTCIMAASI